MKRANGKRKTAAGAGTRAATARKAAKAAGAGLRVPALTDDRVLARFADRRWSKMPDRGGKVTATSYSLPTRADEDEFLERMGAFADHIADIRVAFETIRYLDGRTARRGLVLAAPVKIDEVREKLSLFHLGYQLGRQHERKEA